MKALDVRTVGFVGGPTWERVYGGESLADMARH